MIAEHGDGGGAEFLDEAQHLERLRPAVDQIADQPEPVLPGIEADLRQQPLQRLEAALDVADRVSRMILRVRGRYSGTQAASAALTTPRRGWLTPARPITRQPVGVRRAIAPRHAQLRMRRRQRLLVVGKQFLVELLARRSR